MRRGRSEGTEERGGRRGRGAPRLLRPTQRPGGAAARRPHPSLGASSSGAANRPPSSVLGDVLDAGHLTQGYLTTR